MSVKIRPLKNGGYSECSCPDDLVGKGRCNHVSGDSMQISKVSRGVYQVEVETVKGSEEELKSKIKDTLSKIVPVDKTTSKRIMEELYD